MPLKILKRSRKFIFDQVKEQTQEIWNDELNKIVIKGSDTEKTNFYTAMYHTFINPTTYMDVNGEYKGLDQNIHRAENFTNYTTFSLWDTYRALHPFLILSSQKKRRYGEIHDGALRSVFYENASDMVTLRQ